MNTLLLLSLLALAPRENGVMRSFEAHGFRLTGAEYWAFEGDRPFRYPDEVLWGYYPSAATDAAVGCAETAYAALKRFLESDPPDLREAVWLGAVGGFFLWTNDYTSASPTRHRRTARLWHWSTGDHDWSRGYWKWEATLTQDGRCEVPRDEQVLRAVREAVAALRR